MAAILSTTATSMQTIKIQHTELSSVSHEVLASAAGPSIHHLLLMSRRCCADIIKGKCLGQCHVIRGHARVHSADARPGVLHMVAALCFLLC